MGIWERQGRYTGPPRRKKTPLPLVIAVSVVLIVLLSAVALWLSREETPPAAATAPPAGDTLPADTVETEPPATQPAPTPSAAPSAAPTAAQPTNRIPEYTGEPYVELNGNIPSFSEEDMAAGAFERYSELDDLGRCGPAIASVCKELMPTEDREDISSIKPSGYHNEWYDWIDHGFVYNRCHLIAFAMTGENANEKNLITGTRYMNLEGMFPFESKVLYHASWGGHHVLYRATPIFEGDELVARGVQLEGWSVEDRGQSVCFNVFVFNVQPGVVIDYATGRNHAEEGYVPTAVPAA